MLSTDPPLASPENLQIPLCVDDPAGAIEILEPHIAAFRGGAP